MFTTLKEPKMTNETQLIPGNEMDKMWSLFDKRFSNIAEVRSYTGTRYGYHRISVRYFDDDTIGTVTIPEADCFEEEN